MNLVRLIYNCIIASYLIQKPFHVQEKFTFKRRPLPRGFMFAQVKQHVKALWDTISASKEKQLKEQQEKQLWERFEPLYDRFPELSICILWDPHLGSTEGRRQTVLFQ